MTTLVSGEAVVRDDGVDGAMLDAGPAIDARIGVDVKAFCRGEFGLAGGRVNAIHWAHRGAGRVVAA